MTTFKKENSSQLTLRTPILVTGGGGYIGAHACKALKKANYLPITFDNFSTGWREAVKFGPLAEGDLLRPTSLETAFKKYQPKAVMHFAALSSVKESMVQPERYWSNNVGGSLNLLCAMIKYNCQFLVLSSTAAVYGEPNVQPILESAEKKPINPYGASKLAVETMVDHFADAYGLRSTTLRYFNVAGADPEQEVGEQHIPETHLIPLILEAVMNDSKTITIFGEDYPTPDRTCIRDYIHVTDLISSHILSLEHLLNGGPNLQLNLGTKNGFSVREVIDATLKEVGRSFKVKVGSRRKGDPARLVCDNQQAQEKLGWKPKHSTLQEMIRDAWAWYKKGGFT